MPDVVYMSFLMRIHNIMLYIVRIYPIYPIYSPWDFIYTICVVHIIRMACVASRRSTHDLAFRAAHKVMAESSHCMHYADFAAPKVRKCRIGLCVVWHVRVQLVLSSSLVWAYVGMFVVSSCCFFQVFFFLVLLLSVVASLSRCFFHVLLLSHAASFTCCSFLVLLLPRVASFSCCIFHK